MNWSEESGEDESPAAGRIPNTSHENLNKIREQIEMNINDIKNV